MTVDKVLERLVKRDGMYTDRESGRRGTAQYVGYFKAADTGQTRLVLLTNTPNVKVRELTMDRDGNIHLEADVLDTLRVDRGRLSQSVELYNGREAGKGQILDVLVL